MVVNTAINNTHQIYEPVCVDKYVIMPDHIHMILILQGDSGRAMHAPTVSTIIFIHILKKMSVLYNIRILSGLYKGIRMRTVIVEKKQGYKRIDRFIREAFPHMPPGAMYKALRKKDIKVNGARVKDDHVVAPGDRVEVYIPDRILDGMPLDKSRESNKDFTVIYEDSNILIVNKKQGVPVHPDREQSRNTLIDSVRKYLSEKGEYVPDDPYSFPPSLCHRLDRNTGGLLIIARNSASLKIMLKKIKDREVKKYYQCLVKGKMDRKDDELKAYLVKDADKSRVFISGRKTGDSLGIITKYRRLSYDREKDISRLEVELVTGRTHQIRAHLAYTGHPVIGDGKYGSNEINRAYGYRYQALWATGIRFNFKAGTQMLDYLGGREFEVEPEFM